MLKTFSLGEFNIQKKECMWMYLWEVSQQQMTHTRQYFALHHGSMMRSVHVLKNYETLWIASCSIRCWSPNVTRSVVMVSWFTRNYCTCAPMLYISELCEDCAVANEINYEIDYAWASIHDNGHMITACDVWLQQRIKSKGFITTSDFPYDILSIMLSLVILVSVVPVFSL